MKVFTSGEAYKCSDRTYFIDEIEVAWGLTLEAVRDLIRDKTPLKTYGGWPNLRVQCRHAFGFAATEVNIRGTREEMPVLQVAYELSPLDCSAVTVDPNYWVKALNKFLGSSVKRVEPMPYPVDPSRSGSVVYNNSWVVGNVRYSLSTYGGYRVNEVGAISIAGLFVDFENEMEAASNYLGPIEAIEASLIGINFDSFYSDIVRTQCGQRPYYLPNYHLRNPHCAASNNELRRAQRVLRHPNIFDTPAELARALGENSVLIWPLDNRDCFVLSTKWDSVFFYPEAAKNAISWTNLLPAKGSGGMSLCINGLCINDVHSSKTIAVLVCQASTYQGKEIACETDYDC